MQPQQTRDTSIVEHLPLVDSMVRRMARRLPNSMDKEALYGAAVEGLIYAVDHFDTSRGVSFESYARIRIRGALQDELRSMDHLTRDQRRLVSSVSESRERLTRQYGREVDDVEIAMDTQLPISEVRRSNMHQMSPQLLDPSIMDETVTGSTWQQPENAEAQVLEIERRALVEKELSRLSEREQLVMSLYFGEGLNLTEVGEIMDVSPSRISQIISRVKEQLRNQLADG